MNKGLAFVLGCLVGGAGGGFLARTILKQKYEQRADEMIVSCREAFQEELIKIRQSAEEKESAKKKEAAAEALKKYRGSDEPPPFDSEPQEAKTDPKPNHTVITETEYNDPASPYQKRCLQYFPNDQVVLREDGSIMEQADVEYTIGLETLACFDDETVDSVWIHNDDLQIDYEITQVGMSYFEWKRTYNQ